MKFSVRSDYAARAVLGLARHYPAKTVLRIEDLAAAQNVPPKYLAIILNELRSQGIARSVLGKSGGYMLARPPAEITLGDVLRVTHGKIVDMPALDEAGCPPELRRAWQKLRDTIEATADAITFQQLLEEGAEKDKMYYI